MKFLKTFESDISENKSEHKWIVSSAKRQDGVVFNVEDTYLDGNGKEYTIKEMYVTDKGDVMAVAKEGGAINLWNVRKPE